MATVAEEWLNICGGCEVSILDLGEKLLDVLPSLEFVHMPVLMDHKYFGQTGEKSELEIPEADIGMISGGIRTEKEKHVAEEMRKKCQTLIALGSCACFGGIPALANMYPLERPRSLQIPRLQMFHPLPTGFMPLMKLSK
jgi:F420-non-reducing hydrogenase small subunit